MSRSLLLGLPLLVGTVLAVPAHQGAPQVASQGTGTAVPASKRIIDGPLTIHSDDVCLRLRGARQVGPGGQPIGVTGLDSFAYESVNDLSSATPALATAVRANAVASHSNVSATAIGVEALASSSTEGFTAALRGTAFGDGFEAIGVEGLGMDAIFTSVGVRGRVNDPFGYAMWSDGDFMVSGAKAFAQPHPEDASRMIVFCSLEGNESGTYFRGTTRLTDGRATIPVPEEWRLASEPDGITVQLTPIGAPARVWVAERSRERIVVAGDSDCELDYFVNGVRRGFAAAEPVRENRVFRPEVRGVPYGRQFPEDLRRILVANGTLKPDFTPDEATARALGWRLVEPDDVAVERRFWLTAAERRALLAGADARRR